MGDLDPQIGRYSLRNKLGPNAWVNVRNPYPMSVIMSVIYRMSVIYCIAKVTNPFPVSETQPNRDANLSLGSKTSWSCDSQSPQAKPRMLQTLHTTDDYRYLGRGDRLTQSTVCTPGFRYRLHGPQWTAESWGYCFTSDLDHLQVWPAGPFIMRPLNCLSSQRRITQICLCV